MNEHLNKKDNKVKCFYSNPIFFLHFDANFTFINKIHLLWRRRFWKSFALGCTESAWHTSMYKCCFHDLYPVLNKSIWKIQERSTSHLAHSWAFGQLLRKTFPQFQLNQEWDWQDIGHCLHQCMVIPSHLWLGNNNKRSLRIQNQLHA